MGMFSYKISPGMTGWSVPGSPPTGLVSLAKYIGKENPRILSIDANYLGLGVLTLKKSHLFHHKFKRSN